jgi:hypothetical protein
MNVKADNLFNGDTSLFVDADLAVPDRQENLSNPVVRIHILLAENDPDLSEQHQGISNRLSIYIS